MRRVEFEERLADLIAEALNNEVNDGLPRSEVLSTMELQMMALEEDPEGDA